MAIPCAGVTASWQAAGVEAAVEFGELTEVAVSYGNAIPEARSVVWAFDLGTVEISCLGTANVSVSNYGRKGTLTFGGGGLSLATKAIYERVRMTGTVNDVARYAITFRISDGPTSSDAGTTDAGGLITAF
jgi:hypothetical protein